MRSLLIFILLISFGTGAAQERTSEKLAELLGFGPANVKGMADAARASGRDSEAVCYNSLSTEKLKAASEDFLNDLLTVPEQEAAVAFFTSPLGIRYREDGERTYRRLKKVPGESEPIKFSASEISELISFSNSPAGKKLISTQFSERLRSHKAMNEAMLWMFQQCRK